MIAAIAIVSVLLFALFLVAAVAGNRAQTRMNERDRVEVERLGGAEIDRVGPGA